MIEEAAGTRMYEMKKQAAQKTIEKKDLKLSELNAVSIYSLKWKYTIYILLSNKFVSQILQEEIGPRIERLKKERIQYFELQKVEREFDQLQKIYIAHTFLKTEVSLFINFFGLSFSVFLKYILIIVGNQI